MWAMHLLLALALLLGVMLGDLRAQTVWTVPNGADLTPFISQASPGDILQLGASHPSFVLNKGLVIQTAGTTIQGSLGGPWWLGGTVQVSVPTGQRASLERLSLPSGSDGYSIYSGSLILQGNVVVADVTVDGFVQVNGGCCILQRLDVWNGMLQVTTGLCEITHSVLRGRNSGGWPPYGNTRAVEQTGGMLVASRVTATGGHASPYFTNHQAAVRVVGGSAFFTDCNLTGGDGFDVWSTGAPALIGNGALAIARTTLTSGTSLSGSTASSGFAPVPTMVGMDCAAAPVRGSSLVVVATAGSSQGLLGIVGGYDATPKTIAPIVEPLFGMPSQLVALAIALPAPGAQVAHVVTVPNLAILSGSEVWLQAVQLDGAQIRASTVVGGTIR